MSDVKSYSICHLVPVKVTTKDVVIDGIAQTRRTNTCEKCGEECDLFHGTLADAKEYKKQLEKTGGDPVNP